MPTINIPEAQAITERFEDLIQACEAYRAYLEARRPEAYRGDAATGGAVRHGRFVSDPVVEVPPHGTPEFREFAINRLVVRSIGHTQALIDLLEGDVYDRVRSVIDALGSLESGFRGEWV